MSVRIIILNTYNVSEDGMEIQKTNWNNWKIFDMEYSSSDKFMHLYCQVSS